MTVRNATTEPAIASIEAAAYTVPTDSPESDGTLKWDSTTMVCVFVEAAGTTGFGYTYSHKSAVSIVESVLRESVVGRNPFDIPAIWNDLFGSIRNLGQCGVAMMALSAVDTALWDLKAKLLGQPVIDLLGSVRESARLYGSGGFTSYSSVQMRRQLESWVGGDGMTAVKIKVGRQPDMDEERVLRARETIGDETELFVDANSAYNRKQALSSMHRFAEIARVVWMEQPLDPSDFDGLRLLRDQGPATVDVADGEYGWRIADFQQFARNGALDVVMADLTRCGGITGFLRVDALCDAYGLPLSTHCAPMLHLQPACAATTLRHCEYFHDHVRIERLLLDGFRDPKDGYMTPDRSRPGLGIELKRSSAEPYAA